MALGLLSLLILIPLIFGIPILIGVYVYRDANKRGMNAILWTLVALLTPSLLGLIIYLLVRNNYSDLTCPNCNTRVEESYVMCPNCRTKLRPTCDVCSAPVQTTWKVCPHCGTELPEYSMDVATPVRAKDNTLGKILIAILIIPIAVILLLLLLTIPFKYTESGSYSTGVVTMTMEEFLESQPEFMQESYAAWFETCSYPVNGQPYHIYEYTPDTKTGFPYEYQYLIYIPGATGYADIYPDVSFDMETRGFFRKRDYWTLDLVCKEGGNEQLIFILEYTGDFQPPEDFLITYNGNEEEIRCDASSGSPFYGPSLWPDAE